VPLPKERLAAEYRAIRNHITGRVALAGKVAVQLPYDYLFLLCALACMETGRVYLPLGQDWPASRIEQIRLSSQFDLLLDEAAIGSILAGPAAGEAEAPVPLDPGSILYIIYTSGSTGEPKGVMISRGNYEAFLRFLDGFFPDVRSSDNLLMVARYTFDMSLLDVGMLLVRQLGYFFSRSAGSAFQLALEIEDYRITWIDAVPNQIGIILDDAVFSRADLASLRHLVLGGSRFPWKLLEELKTKLAPEVDLVNAYGPTETTVYTHFKRFTRDPGLDAHEGTLSVGSPTPETACALLDPGTGRPISEPLVRGELLLGGAQLMLGYCNDPERTARCLVQVDGTTYYRTGDVSYRNSRGDYFIVGRMDETIKRRGYRINLLDIDSYIQRVPGVLQCMTLAYPADGIDHFILAVVQRDQDNTMTAEHLRAELAALLVEYQIPDHIEFLASLPQNASCKLSRNALMEQFRTTADRILAALGQPESMERPR
jgi:acyl-CoA synthetase (AMP-forming)/AMP-acid ligase II